MEGKTGNPPPYTEQQRAQQQHPPAPVVLVPGTMPPNAVAAVVVTQQMGPTSSPTVCRSCGANISTRVIYKPTTNTHLFALLLCVFGCWCCVCIPYCTDSCQSADHYCPNCNAYIGAYTS